MALVARAFLNRWMGDTPDDTRSSSEYAPTIGAMQDQRAEQASASREFCTPIDLTHLLVRVSGALAAYCDRSEHSEGADREVITAEARQLRRLAVDFSRSAGFDLQALYADRLAGIESRHPAFSDGMYDGAEAVRRSKSWSEMQSAQYRHDLTYHPDVLGLAKWDQVRHYTLHIAKLAMLALNATDDAKSGANWESFLAHRLPDVLIFGIKLSTVTGEKLTDCASLDQYA